MKTDKKIAFIGGDLRSLAAARELSCELDVSIYGFTGHTNAPICPVIDPLCCSEVSSRDGEGERMLARLDLRECAGLDEALDGASAVILPLPATRGDAVTTLSADCVIRTNLLLDAMQAKNIAVIFGGKLTHELVDACERRGITAYDYYSREDFTIANAAVTAEGALGIALDELDIALRGANALVIGYGRIGRCLAALLNSVGANTTVTARKPSDRAWIEASGYAFADSRAIAGFLARSNPDVIFNTVPCTLLSERELALIGRDVPIIDLASKPGGVDTNAASRLDRRVIWALSLPGKTAPITAGKILADTLRSCFKEIELC